MLLILIITALAIKIDGEPECYDDGSFIIPLKADSEKYTYTKEIKVTVDGKSLKGTWSNDKIKLTANSIDKYATFTGLEDQLIEKKTYTIKLDYKLRTESFEEDEEMTFDLECPGLFFTCNRLGIKINDCLTSKTGKFTSNIEIYGLEQSAKGKMDPLEVIDFLLDTQILYKDIDGLTSKKGSLPEGATVVKVSDNKYLVESNFPKYTTNHVTTMKVIFNDNLKRPCNPVDYSDVIFTNQKECVYKETEEDRELMTKEDQEKQKLIEEQSKLILEKSVEEKIKSLETKKFEIENELSKLYIQTGRNSEESEENKVEEKKQESMNTGYSVKESSGLTKKQGRLKIMSFFMIGVIALGGLLLFYLYREGYFY